MDKRILIVHPNSDMIMTIINLLHEIRSQGYRLSEKCAKTSIAAQQSFPAAEPIDLLITGVEIPEGTKPSAGAGEQRRQGLELARRFRALSPGMATILVSTGQLDNDLAAFYQSEGRCGLVVEGKGFQEHLTNEIIKYVRPHKPEAPSRVNLLINLSTEPGNSYYEF
jgi:CheY-like chemotaxis protein